MKKDTRLLRAAYLRAGIGEYWLIDARGDEITFEILMNAGDQSVSSGDPSIPQQSRALGGHWRLTRARNRAGRFTYTLDR